MQDFIKKIQTHPQNIINFSIIAHIDHGKSSLTDSLLGANQLIAQSQQGHLRQLDYLQIEQEKLITVKSSAASIVYPSINWKVQQKYQVIRQQEAQKLGIQLKEDDINKPVPILYHLFDTPGHSDFTSAVLSSLSLTDGALILIDSVEGIQSQTKCFLDTVKFLNIDCVLVINKLDRLFCELKYTSLQIAQRIFEIIEEVNQYLNVEYFNIKQNVIMCCSTESYGIFLPTLIQNYTTQCKVFHSYKDQKDELLQAFSKMDTVLTKQGIKQTKTTEKCLLCSYCLDVIRNIYQLTDQKQLQIIFNQITGQQLTLKTKIEDTKISCLNQIFPLAQSIFDASALNMNCGIQTHNKYVQKLQQIENIQFIAITGSTLLDIEIVDEQQSQAIDNSQNLSLIRIIQNNNQQHQLDIRNKIISLDGQEYQILRVFQPLGREFKILNYNQFASGCIIGIQTDKRIKANSVIYQIKQQINQNIVDKIDKIQRKYLKVQKPLLKVGIQPENIYYYNNLYNIIKQYTEANNNVEFQLTNSGQIELIVCGDVHLELVMNEIQKTTYIKFKASETDLDVLEKCTHRLSKIQPQKTEQIEQTMIENKNILKDQQSTSTPEEFIDILCSKTQYNSQEQNLLYPYNFSINSQQIICKLQLYIDSIDKLITINTNIELTEQQSYLTFQYPNEQNKEIEALCQIIFNDLINHGPLCKSQVTNIHMIIEYNIEKVENPLNLYLDTFLLYRHYIFDAFEDIQFLIQQTFINSDLRICEFSYQLKLTNTLEHQSIITQCQQKYRCSQVQYDKTLNIILFVPQSEVLSFINEIRTQSSGIIGITFIGTDYILNQNDPRHVNITKSEEELIEFGDKGENLANSAQQIVDKVLKLQMMEQRIEHLKEVNEVSYLLKRSSLQYQIRQIRQIAVFLKVRFKHKICEQQFIFIFVTLY